MPEATSSSSSSSAGPASQWTTNMTASSLTSVAGNSCLDEQIERLKRCEYLREGEVKALCLRAREILVDESNVQRVDAPVTVRKNVSVPVRSGVGFGSHEFPLSPPDRISFEDRFTHCSVHSSLILFGSLLPSFPRFVGTFTDNFTI